MTVTLTRKEMAESFGKAIPNVQRVSWGHYDVTVWFDGIHSRRYSWPEVENFFHDHWRGHAHLTFEPLFPRSES